MKHFRQLTLFFLALLFSTFQLSAEEKKIAVVIPSYNNAVWYQITLDSVFMQEYDNFRVIFINDASTDGMGPLVQKYVREKGWEKRFTYVENRKREGALANVYRGIWLCDPDEIVANLDGDDWFPHTRVLSKLNEVYSDKDVWVTYGQFIYYPCNTPGWAAEVPQSIIAQNAFRDHTWTTTALRTFYAGLFQKIKKEDLLYEGAFFPMSGDLAYMWPILEMAGFHSRFIPDILYVYNVESAINDVKKDPDMQRHLGLITRERKRYQPIKKPY